MKREIILASASPRRRGLMAQTGLPFTVRTMNVPEIVPDGIPAGKQSEYLAGIKAGAMAAYHEEALIIGADTTVICEGRILGKPRDAAQARKMLHTLSGKTHTVVTGVALICKEWSTSFSVQTRVTFYPLSDEEIDAYVATGEPMDKAGAYGIQGGAFRFVEKIDGDYNNVIGLPIARLVRTLERYGAETGRTL